MKEITIKCDVCSEEYVTCGRTEVMHVIFETEQNEGRSSKPYISINELDLCNKCYENVLKGHYIFASGAMGHNKYYFK